MNAKKELLEALTGISKLKCAEIIYGRNWFDEDSRKIIKLTVNYTQDEFESFLKELNFGYDAGYGGQELFGTVWLEDGSWLERGEYDGSEWWAHKKCPNIPSHLFKV